MAYLSETKLRGARAQVNGQLESQEVRMPAFGVLDAVNRQNRSSETILSADARQKIQNSQGRTVEVGVYKDVDVTVKSARSCVIDDFHNETVQVLLTSAEIVADISMFPAQYGRNQVDYTGDLAKKLRRVGKAFSVETESLITAAWDTNKSVIYNSPLIPTKYPLLGDTIQVSLAQQQYFFNEMSSIMQSDDFNDMPYDVIGNTTLSAIVRQWGNQGNANAQNSGFQFGDFNFDFANSVPVTAAALSTAYCMPQGSTGLELQNTSEAKSRISLGGGLKEWYEATIPVFNKKVSVSYNADCVDASVTLGEPDLVNTAREAWQFSTKVFIVTPYDSDPVTRATGIKKIDFLAS